MRKKAKFRVLLVTGLLSVLSCGNRGDDPVVPVVGNKETKEIPKYIKYFVPISGNSFITVKPESATEVINDKQLTNWTNSNSVISTYFRVGKSGKLNVGVKASVPNDGTSTIKVTVNGTEKKIFLEGPSSKEYDAGEFEVSKPGYVKVDIQGVEKTGEYFAEITDITFGGEAATGENIFAYKPTFYKNIRRGPSSDIYYTLPEKDIQYFYNEAVILEDNSNMGFIPFQFSSGFLSMTNEKGEKSIYFEVLKEYEDLNKIPEDKKTKVLKKGENVSIREFHDGISMRTRGTLKYNWEVGRSYKFLVKVKPDGDHNVDYTAWFLPPNESSWKLIISLKKKDWEIYPGKKLYNFLENHDPEYGFMSNKVELNKPWVMNGSGTWIPITEVNFSTYDIDVYKQRTDAIAKATRNGFLLQNGGFFNDIVNPDFKISRPKDTESPDIDFSNLP